MSSTAKITAIEAKISEDLSRNEFYDAHQKARTITRLLIRDADWPRAIEVLDNLARAMLKAGQGGSGGDLAVTLVDVYKRAELVPDPASKGRLLAILRLFDPAEPTRKKFVTAMIGWSSKFGAYPAGDPELHHVAGSLFAQELNVAAAEAHLILGTKDSAAVLSRLHYAWYKSNDVHMAPIFCARAVLPSLLMGNLRAANACYAHFVDSLVTDKPQLVFEKITSHTVQLRAFPSLPLLNFLALLLLATQRSSPELFTALRSQYKSDLEGVEWDGVLDVIAEMYFRIQRNRPVNIMDMMGNMFGGGMSGGGR